MKMQMRQELQETRKQGTPMHPLKIYRMQDMNGMIDVPYHWQETVEILWMQKGELNLRIKEVNYTGKRNDIFYVNPRELHGMQAKTQDCLYFAFVFPMSWLQFAQADEVNEKYIRPLAELTAHITTYLSPEANSPAISILQEIYEWYESSEEGVWLGIKANLLRFYHYMYQNHMVSFQEKDNSAHMQLLLDISQYINLHCAEKLSLEKLGGEFHMSPKYFSDYFKKHFSRGFTDYLTAVRIEKAKKLLLETDWNMELIAQQTGFSGSSYFIRAFRKSLHMTPAQYRKSFIV